VPPEGAAPRERLSLLLQVYALDQRMRALVDRELERDGVSADDYALLSTVGVRGPSTPTELAADLGLPLTTASDAIRRLLERGHVRKLPNERDRRSFRVELTPAGDRDWKRGWPALRRVNDAIERHLTIDASAARELLERLDEAMERALTET
jgi:DNA-binding MarR family transcriptional regulator